MSLLAFALIPALLLSMFAHGTPEPGAAPTIPPIEWQMTSITPADGEMQVADDPSRYTMQFMPDGSILMKADCNQARASYTVEDGVLTILPGPTTLAMCPEDSLSSHMLLLLDTITAFHYDENGNLILSGEGGSMTLQPTLENVVWEWQQFQGSDDSLVTPPDPSHYTVTFLPEGKLAIQADCNRAKGTFNAKQPEVALKVGGITRMMCPADSLMDVFLRHLEESTSYVFRDGKLHLALKIDGGIVTFAAAAIPADAGTPVAPAATPAP